MPRHKSAEKRVKTNEKRNQRNTSYKSMMKTAIKKVRGISSKETIQQELNKTYSLLDRLASKGIIHKNKVANKKSKLAKYANKLS